MDRIEGYREIIKRVIREFADFLPGYANVKAEIILDDDRGHYILFYTGWDGKKRVHGSAIHIDVLDGRVWVQHDGTDQGVVDALVDAGIPESDVVLGFHHPELRKYTEFASA